MSNELRRPGRHFLQIPGPTPVPERILNAMRGRCSTIVAPTSSSGKKVLADVKTMFKTDRPVIIYPSSGTGAWEAGSSIRCRPAITC